LIANVVTFIGIAGAVVVVYREGRRIVEDLRAAKAEQRDGPQPERGSATDPDAPD
jgi:hypothetical protein